MNDDTLLCIFIWLVNAKNISIKIMVISLPCHPGKCCFGKCHCATMCEDFCMNSIVIIDLYCAYPSIDALACTRLFSSAFHHASTNAPLSTVLRSRYDSPIRRSDIAGIVHKCPLKYFAIKFSGTIEIVSVNLKMYNTVIHKKKNEIINVESVLLLY